MKTEHTAGGVRLFMIVILGPALFLAATGCSGGYGSGGGGGGALSPAITSLNPTSGSAGTPVTITGNYFGATQGYSTVSFNSAAATPTSWSNTTIDVPVPAGATSGNVVVTVGGVASNGVSFTVTGSGGGPSPGWAWIQDSPLIFCQGSGRTSCNPGLGNIVPTVAGSVWVLQIQTPNNVTIQSINPGNGGGTWIYCSACHVTNPSGFTADAWYNLTGSAGFDGANPFGFTLSGSAGTFLSANFVELLPPPGTTASFDAAGTAAPSGCTTCTAASLAISGTDAIWQNPGGGPNINWNAWSAPYFSDYNGGGVCLNCTSGAAPTKTFGNTNQNPEFMAIAFKSSAGTFTPPVKQHSIVNFTALSPSACSTCTLTIPATGAGHLLFLEAGNEAGTFISSVSGGGTWAVPMGTNSCQAKQVVQTQNNAASCAYNLSSSSGTTTLTVTMAGSAAHNFAVWEIATAQGSFFLDTLGSTLNTSGSCSGFCFSGQPLTLGGANDVVFQLAWDVGGSLGPNYYPQPQVPAQGTVIGPLNYFLQNEVAVVVLLDSGSSAPTPTWINAVPNQPTFVTGVAFKTQ